MGTAVAERGVATFRSAGELREVLDRVLAAVDVDEVAGPLLRATGLRIRFEFRDIALSLNVAASEDGGEHHLRWDFGDRVTWEPRLRLEMDAEVANGYFQGRQSLAVAIARNQVKLSGQPRFALLYVPAMRLVIDRYRRLVRDEYPHLALA
jgi:hypothetical protein